jgi:hypothetical protein
MRHSVLWFIDFGSSNMSPMSKYSDCGMSISFAGKSFYSAIVFGIMRGCILYAKKASMGGAVDAAQLSPEHGVNCGVLYSQSSQVSNSCYLLWTTQWMLSKVVDVWGSNRWGKAKESKTRHQSRSKKPKWICKIQWINWIENLILVSRLSLSTWV